MGVVDEVAAPTSSAASTIPGSGAMSPSIEHAVRDDEDRPDRPGAVGTAVLRGLAEDLAQRLDVAVGKTLRGALDRRIPSMIEAWLSASETIRSCSPVMVGMTPVFAVKPDWNVRTASTPLNSASSASSDSCSAIVPAIVPVGPARTHRSPAGPRPEARVVGQPGSRWRGRDDLAPVDHGDRTLGSAHDAAAGTGASP